MPHEGKDDVFDVFGPSGYHIEFHFRWARGIAVDCVWNSEGTSYVMQRTKVDTYKKKWRETIEKINQLEQVESNNSGISPIFTISNLPWDTARGYKSFLTMNYFFIFITKLQGVKTACLQPCISDK